LCTGFVLCQCASIFSAPEPVHAPRLRRGCIRQMYEPNGLRTAKKERTGLMYAIVFNALWAAAGRRLTGRGLRVRDKDRRGKMYNTTAHDMAEQEQQGELKLSDIGPAEMRAAVNYLTQEIEELAHRLSKGVAENPAADLASLLELHEDRNKITGVLGEPDRNEYEGRHRMALHDALYPRVVAARFECECGCVTQSINAKKHLASKKHQRKMADGAAMEIRRNPPAKDIEHRRALMVSLDSRQFWVEVVKLDIERGAITKTEGRKRMRPLMKDVKKIQSLFD